MVDGQPNGLGRGHAIQPGSATRVRVHVVLVAATDRASVLLLSTQRVALLRCDPVLGSQVIGTDSLGADPMSMLAVRASGAVQTLPAALGSGSGTGHERFRSPRGLHCAHLASADAAGSISVTARPYEGGTTLRPP